MILSGIYKITSISHPEREYIGSAVNIYNRWYDHTTGLRANKHGNQRLQNHVNKYGINDLIFSIMICCMPSELINAEQYFIDTINPYFNICRTAGNRLNCRFTEATKEKLRQANLGKKQSDETKRKIGKANIGKHKMSESNKQKLREASKSRRGFTVSPETRAKISAAKIGIKRHPHSEETKIKIGLKSKGRKHSEESRRKIGLASLGNHYTKGRVMSKEEIERRKIANPHPFQNKKSMKGIKLTDAHRQAIRDSWIIRRQNKIA